MSHFVSHPCETILSLEVVKLAKLKKHLPFPLMTYLFENVESRGQQQCVQRDISFI